jgi:hypothetical protein
MRSPAVELASGGAGAGGQGLISPVAVDAALLYGILLKMNPRDIKWIEV